MTCSRVPQVQSDLCRAGPTTGAWRRLPIKYGEFRNVEGTSTDPYSRIICGSNLAR
ncbi:hypothetical protein ACOI1H_09935 [Loktanella sp. DJP18]|uniref:hypothetical protein n=1 Tax=Loktanella sp. DJP18 TaxID=3409788 RepID=UPI003BB7FFC1